MAQQQCAIHSSMMISRGRSTRKTVYRNNNSNAATSTEEVESSTAHAKENFHVNSSGGNNRGVSSTHHTCFVKNINYCKEGAYTHTMTTTLDRKVRAKYTHRRQRSDDTDTIQSRVRSLLHNPIHTNGSLHVASLEKEHFGSNRAPSTAPRRSNRRNNGKVS